MSSFTEIRIIDEFVSKASQEECKIYAVKFKNRNLLFLVSDGDVFTYKHSKGKTIPECIKPVDKKVKKEFLEEVERLKL